MSCINSSDWYSGPEAQERAVCVHVHVVRLWDRQTDGYVYSFFFHFIPFLWLDFRLLFCKPGLSFLSFREEFQGEGPRTEGFALFVCLFVFFLFLLVLYELHVVLSPADIERLLLLLFFFSLFSFSPLLYLSRPCFFKQVFVEENR